MELKSFLKKYDPIFLTSLVLLSFYILVAFYLSFFGNLAEQQFSQLSSSFLKGKLYFLDTSKMIEDAVLWNGRFYWPLGPFPSILLMPFVLVFQTFRGFFYQGYLQFVLNIVIFLQVQKLASKLGWNKVDSYFLAFGFMFASVYQFMVFMSWSWYFVQVICTFLLLEAIHEFLGKKRFFLIGVYLGCVFLSRFTAGIGILFFILMVLFDKTGLNKFRSIIYLSVPVAFSGIVLLTYNYFRFSDIWQNGYSLANNFLFSDAQRYELINHGLFKLSNIPTNFYYYFVKTLDPVLIKTNSLFGNTYFLQKPYITLKYPGTSFFVVSPLFLYLFKADLKRKITLASLFTIVASLPFFLCYYWVGWRQVGPRYLVDVFPFLYILLLYSFNKNKLGVLPKALMIISSILNFYLFFAIFNG
jgi:hypothetical protein